MARTTTSSELTPIRNRTFTPWVHWPFANRRVIAHYDRVYRFLHNLDSSASEVGPAVRVEVRRSHRTLHLADGTTIRRGERTGEWEVASRPYSTAGGKSVNASVRRAAEPKLSTATGLSFTPTVGPLDIIAPHLHGLLRARTDDECHRRSVSFPERGLRLNRTTV
jgi:hypothetical protein